MKRAILALAASMMVLPKLILVPACVDSIPERFGAGLSLVHAQAGENPVSYPIRVLTSRQLDVVTSENGSGSHWESTRVTIKHNGAEVFNQAVSVHDRCGENMWLCGDAWPRSILVFQPWCVDVEDRFGDPVGFRMYRFSASSGKYLVSEQIPVSAWAIFLRNPLEGLDV